MKGSAVNEADFLLIAPLKKEVPRSTPSRTLKIEKINLKSDAIIDRPMKTEPKPTERKSKPEIAVKTQDSFQRRMSDSHDSFKRRKSDSGSSTSVASQVQHHVPSQSVIPEVTAEVEEYFRPPVSREVKIS
jgi:hypothetical protein